MKLNFLALIFLLVVLSCKEESVIPKPTEDSLISYYSFEGNSNDIFGSNDGLSNEMNYSYLTKENNEMVAEFDGLTSYIDLSNSFDLENRTISFWFQAKEVPAAGALIFVSDNPILQYGFSIFSVRKDGGASNFYFNYSNAIVTVPIEEGKWYHVAATLEGKNYQYYFDGTQVSSGSFSDYLKSGNGHTAAVVGCSRIFDRIFTGSIDDLRIYSRALKQAEIEVLARP